jgi:hypothetical protein
MPVRIRQVPPPRESVEIKGTVDVSRNGILFRTREHYELNTTIWVTMPFNPNLEERPPEFPATVVRVIRMPDGDLEIGVQFHSAYADRWHNSRVYASEKKPVTSTEKRTRNRVKMTLPLRIRCDGARPALPMSPPATPPHLWIEESVTLDVSRTGVLFVSQRPYSLGQKVWVCMPYQPGGTIVEEPAEVIRFVDRGSARGVAVRFTGRDKPGFV